MSNITLPEGYISVVDGMPEPYTSVNVIMDDGTKTIGHFYDNEYRSGWMTITSSGLLANQIWSGVRVLGWKE